MEEVSLFSGLFFIFKKIEKMIKYLLTLTRRHSL